MTLSDDVRDYWNTRAEGYSLHNCDELDGGTGLVLEHLFRTELGAKPGMRALDAGCGPGIFSIVLARLGCRVTGMDLSPEMLEHAGANAKSRGLDAGTLMNHNCMSYGPGSLELAHKPNEYVPYEDVCRVEKVLSVLAENVLFS